MKELLRKLLSRSKHIKAAHSGNAFWFPADTFATDKRPRLYICMSNLAGERWGGFNTRKGCSPSGNWQQWFYIKGICDISFEFKRRVKS